MLVSCRPIANACTRKCIGGPAGRVQACLGFTEFETVSFHVMPLSCLFFTAGPSTKQEFPLALQGFFGALQMNFGFAGVFCPRPEFHFGSSS